MDYRLLNVVTIADRYPLPRIQDNLELLQGSRVLSTLDATWAYHVLPIAKKMRLLLASMTPFRVWQYKKLLFGIFNSVS